MTHLRRGVKCFYKDLEILTFLVILDIGTDRMEGGCCGWTCPSSPLTTKVEMVQSETVPQVTASMHWVVVQHLWWKSKHSATMKVEGMEHQESHHEGPV